MGSRFVSVLILICIYLLISVIVGEMQTISTNQLIYTRAPFPVSNHIVGYYRSKIHYIGGIDEYNSNYSIESYVNETNTAPYEISSLDVSLEWTPILTGLLRPYYSSICKSKCYTEYDKYLYILYDNSNQLIIYDYDTRFFEVRSFFITGEDEYSLCLVIDSTGSIIYGIGSPSNILIYNIITSTLTFSSSTVFNRDTTGCSIDNNNNIIYIFNDISVVKYYIETDTLITLYDRTSISSLPFNLNISNEVIHSSLNTYSLQSNSDSLVWIRDDYNIHLFSTITDTFLSCSVNNNIYLGSSLFSINNLLFISGGIRPQNNDLSMNVFQINTNLNDINFIIRDWIFPSSPSLSINYSSLLFKNFTNAANLQVILTSDYFNNLPNISISDLFHDDKGECVICLDEDGSCINYNKCEDGIDINEFIIDNTNNIDIKNVFYSIETTSAELSIASSAEFGFICASFPIYPIYLHVNVTLLSDDYFYFQFDYEYLCSGCDLQSFGNGAEYGFQSVIEFNSYDLGINSNLIISIINGSCTIEDPEDAQVYYNCSSYPIKTLYEIYFNGEYLINLYSSDTFLESTVISLELQTGDNRECRSGTGYNNETNSCSLCIDNTFSLSSNLAECYSCSNLDGIQCDGSNVLIVEYKYWISAYRESDDQYYTLFDMENDDIILSHICGFGQCCNEENGCNYVNSFNTLCANHRDITSPMCTGCIADYYELLSSNDCGICDHYDNMYYLIGTFALSFILTLYLACFDAKPLDIMIENIKHSNKNDDDIHNKQDNDKSSEDIEFAYFVADSYIANSALIFQIFVYYFQGFAEILSNAGSRAFLSPIINAFSLQFFNDQIGTNGDVDNVSGFCAIPFSTSLSEILMSLIFPGMMLFSLLLIYSFCSKGCGTSFRYKPYVGIAFFRVFIILIGIVFRVLMHIVTCTEFRLNNSYVQFYFNDYCFEAGWWVALCIFIVVFIFFIQIYFKLIQQEYNERYSLSNKYTKLIQGYKNEYWYWELITTTRRLIISLFVSLQYIGAGYSNLILCILMIIYLIAHLTIYPWKHIRNNRIETFCLLSLCAAFIGINFNDIANSLFLSLFLSFVIFIPIIISIYYIIKLCINCKKYYDGNTEYFIDSRSKSKNQKDKMELMIKRVLGTTNNITSSTYNNDQKQMTKIIKTSYNHNDDNDTDNSDTSCGLTE